MASTLSSFSLRPQAELKDSRLSASQNRIVSSLTKKQVDEYKEAFSVFDKDGDGHITPNEMEAALKAMGTLCSLSPA